MTGTRDLGVLLRDGDGALWVRVVGTVRRLGDGITTGRRRYRRAVVVVGRVRTVAVEGRVRTVVVVGRVRTVAVEGRVRTVAVEGRVRTVVVVGRVRTVAVEGRLRTVAVVGRVRTVAVEGRVRTVVVVGCVCTGVVEGRVRTVVVVGRVCTGVVEGRVGDRRRVVVREGCVCEWGDAEGCVGYQRPTVVDERVRYPDRVVAAGGVR